MPLRHRVIWGAHNPFSDPRLDRLDAFVRDIRMNRRLPPGVVGGSVFENRDLDLSPRPYGYYREYDLTQAEPGGRDMLRLVLGDGGEVFITGNHYEDFRQVLNMPG